MIIEIVVDLIGVIRIDRIEWVVLFEIDLDVRPAFERILVNPEIDEALDALTDVKQSPCLHLDSLPRRAHRPHRVTPGQLQLRSTPQSRHL